MKIDDRVESLTREALTAVVKQDAERLERAISAFPDDASFTAATQLATATAMAVIYDAYGRTPDTPDLEAVASKVVEMEPWTDLTDTEVSRFLTAVAAGRPVDAILPAQRIALVGFVTAGNLLSSCCRDDEQWFNYLDRIEAAIESSRPPL